MMNPNNTPLIRIDWEDIALLDNWGEDDSWPTPKECYLVGHILSNTPAALIIGSAYDWQEGTWGTIHALPKMPPRVTVIQEVYGD
jgi:hypothetical protein